MYMHVITFKGYSKGYSGFVVYRPPNNDMVLHANVGPCRSFCLVATVSTLFTFFQACTLWFVCWLFWAMPSFFYLYFISVGTFNVMGMTSSLYGCMHVHHPPLYTQWWSPKSSVHAGMCLTLVIFLLYMCSIALLHTGCMYVRSLFLVLWGFMWSSCPTKSGDEFAPCKNNCSNKIVWKLYIGLCCVPAYLWFLPTQVQWLCTPPSYLLDSSL